MIHQFESGPRAIGAGRFAGSSELIVLGHEEPSASRRDANGQPAGDHPSSEAVRAVEPLIEAHGGVWIAHDGGDPSQEPGPREALRGMPAAQRYRVRRVRVSDEELQGYHHGFANEALWALCHRTHVRPRFRSNDLQAAWSVNARFAAAASEEAASATPTVLVQDHHLVFAPSILRERLPHATIIAFWHAPWPDWQTFDICPWRHQILDSLLRSTVIGFQSSTDCRNFIDTVEHTFEARFDRQDRALVCGGRRVYVRAYPTSIRWKLERPPYSGSPAAARREVCDLFGLDPAVRLGVSVDSLDPAKGVEEKLLAIERLLETYPEFTRGFVFVQAVSPASAARESADGLRGRVRAAAERINRRFGDVDYCPLILLEDRQTPADVARLMRAADVCCVGSLHEGTSLAAKEFVRERDDERGVLVLSEFTGASRELASALPVNPYDVDGAAATLAAALAMDEGEQSTRMRRLRQAVCDRDAYTWAAEVLTDAARLAQARDDDRLAPFGAATADQTMMPLRTA